MLRVIGVGLAVGAIQACWAGGAVGPQPLTVDHAVRTALANRAEVDAAASARVAADGRLRQAGLRPNPVLSLQTENWRAWGTPGLKFARDMNIFASVSGTVETGGKRRARMAAAASDQFAADADRQALEWAVETEVRRAFVVASEARRRSDLLAAGLAPYRELERYERARLREGAAAEIDVIKVEVELRKAELRASEAEMRAAAALRELLLAMGVQAPADQMRLADARGPIQLEPPDVDSLRATALESHPRLLAARAYAEQARTSTAVEQTLAKPDVTPYFGYKRDGPFNSLIGGLSVPLPLSNRNQGAIESATAEHRRREALVRALEAQVLNRIEAAADAWRRHAAIARGTAEGPARRAREAREIAAAAYREQGVSLLFLLDAQRTETDAALAAAQAHEQYRLSRAALEAAAGETLEGGSQ